MKRSHILSLLVTSLLSLSASTFASPATNNSSTPPVLPITNVDAKASNQTAGSPNAIGFHDSDAIFAAIDTAQNTAVAQPPDVREQYNRDIYSMNDAFDKGLIQPLARGYMKVVPQPMQNMIHNFYSNIDMLPTSINDVLQANFYQATNDTWRLIINSSVGLLGTFDVAKHIGLQENHEDFGLTLARWGWTQSTFFMLPILGPNTVRDVIGRPINYYLFSVYPYITPWYAEYGVYGMSLLDTRVQLMQYNNLFEQAAIDPYVLMRDSYYQLRNAKIEANRHLGSPNTAETTNSFRDPAYLYQ